MRTRLVVVVLTFVTATSSVLAQAPVRLRLEILKNGSLVASPEFSVDSGKEASIDAEGVGNIRFTPTVRSSDSLRIEFTIESSGKRFNPYLVLKNGPGSVSWSSNDRNRFELRISRVH